MHKPCTYLALTYILIYVPIYGVELLLPEWVIEVKPDINLLEVHPIIESWWVSSGWCAGGYWFTLVQNAELVPLPPPWCRHLRDNDGTKLEDLHSLL